MTLFIEDGAPVIVQGMTGHQGMTHTARMLKAGTNIVGGVNARKAGLDVTFPEAKNGEDATIHVFANCSEAIEATGAKASVVFVPPRFAKDAVVEAIEAGIELIVVITESIPVADSAYFVELALRKGVRIVGPNCPGLLTLPSSKDAKGCNAERCLMIPGYAATSSPAGTAAIALPTVDGEAAANIIVSVHSYDPQTFCLQDTQTTFDPEKDGAKINRVFENIKETFLDRGIPVVMGETGATNTNGNHDERAKWAYCVAQNAQRYGVPIVIWDNGNNQTSGGECHAWIRRAVNPKLRSQATSVVYPQVLDALWEGKNSTAWGSALTEVRAEADESILWANADGLTSQKEWDSSYIQLEAKMEWFADGARIGIRYSGAGTPKIVLDSAEKSVWWILVDAAEIQKNDDGTKTAWFTSEILLAEMRKNGVDNPAQLQNCYVIATNGKITAYRITVEGMATALTTYHVNGSAIHQADLPDAPTYPHMTFCGWYTTPDYQPGTEVTGASGASDAWAKMALDMSVIK